MVWFLATLPNGTTMKYGIPLDERLHCADRDFRLHFIQMEILYVDYDWKV